VPSENKSDSDSVMGAPGTVPKNLEENPKKAGTESVELLQKTDHTLYTANIIRRVLESGDDASQWKSPKFDSSPHENPLINLHQNWYA